MWYFLIILRFHFTFHSMNSLTSYINTEIKPLKHSDSIMEAQLLFEDFSYSHFPVTEEGIYIGCITKETVEFSKSEVILSNSTLN